MILMTSFETWIYVLLPPFSHAPEDRNTSKADIKVVEGLEVERCTLIYPVWRGSGADNNDTDVNNSVKRCSGVMRHNRYVVNRHPHCSKPRYPEGGLYRIQYGSERRDQV